MQIFSKVPHVNLCRWHRAQTIAYRHWYRASENHTHTKKIGETIELRREKGKLPKQSTKSGRGSRVHPKKKGKEENKSAKTGEGANYLKVLIAVKIPPGCPSKCLGRKRVWERWTRRKQSMQRGASRVKKKRATDSLAPQMQTRNSQIVLSGWFWALVMCAINYS